MISSFTLLQISALWSFSIYTSPFILTTLYRREMFTPTGAVTLSKFLMGVCAIYFLSLNIRALGRASNPTYREFLDVLTLALRDMNTTSKGKLQLYDFEFSSWPIEFSMKKTNRFVFGEWSKEGKQLTAGDSPAPLYVS